MKFNRKLLAAVLVVCLFMSNLVSASAATLNATYYETSYYDIATTAYSRMLLFAQTGEASWAGGTTAPATPNGGIAYASSSIITVDGKPVDFQAYALKDANDFETNYLKLRDVAYILNGTAAQFQVDWDGSVVITTGAAYTANGSEMSTPFSGDHAYEDASAATMVNGTPVQLSAILLKDASGNGYTYYKLRDLGQALGFNVDWSSERGIYIETDKPYNAPDSQSASSNESAVCLANGKPITDENIQEILYGLQADYPQGMRWTNDDFYASQALFSNGFGCEGFGLICSDAVFGDLPITSTHSDFDAIRVGDLIRMNNDTHTVIVLEKRENSVVVAEGNYNSSINWGREISRQTLVNGNFTVRTRYPA